MVLLCLAYVDPTTQRPVLLREPLSGDVAAFDRDLAWALAAFLSLRGAGPVGLLPPPVGVRTHLIRTATEALPLAAGLLAALAAIAVMAA